MDHTIDPLINVSRETDKMLSDFAALALRWNASINLVSRKDAGHLRTRHIADSAQLFAHAPQDARSWLDLGSGGGFPGLICAILAKVERPDLNFTLIESDARKCAFLREATRVFDLDVTVQTCRIEDAAALRADIVSARALAALPKLLDLAHRFCHAGTVLLFPKGRTAESELTLARQTWHISSQSLPSRTDPQGVVLKLSEVTRKP